MVTTSFPYKFTSEHAALTKKFEKPAPNPESFIKPEGANRRLEAVDALTWTADGHRLALCAKDGSIRVYRGEEARGTEELFISGSWTHTEAHPSNGELVACVSWDGRVRLLDLRGGYSECKVEEKIFASSFSCDGNKIAVHTRNDAVQVYDARNLSAPVVSSVNLRHEVHSSVWAGSGFVWAAMGNGDITRIDFTDSVIDNPSGDTCLTQAPAHQGPVMCLARNSGGSTIVSAGADGVVAIWNTEKMFCERTIAEAATPVTDMSVSGCGRLVSFVCGKDGDPSIYVGGVNTGIVYANIEMSGPVTKVAFHPNRTTLAYAMHQQQGDSIVQIFNFE